MERKRVDKYKIVSVAVIIQDYRYETALVFFRASRPKQEVEHLFLPASVNRFCGTSKP